jgi:hypothetical protein
LGDRVGEERRNVSHAKAFRRDLQRAFVAATERGESAPAKDSRRWKQLFTETDYTLPIDFHSWRRAYAQALADADVSAQQASALAGHADLGAHARYLRNAEKMRVMPAAALPRVELSQKAKPIVSTTPNLEESDSNAPDALVRKSMELHAIAASLALSGAEGRGFESPTARNQVVENIAESGIASDGDRDQKTKRETKPAVLTPLPARPAVRMVDLLAAIDAAILAGDAHAARSLVAEATRLERERSSKGDSQALGSADSP